MKRDPPNNAILFNSFFHFYEKSYILQINYRAITKQIKRHGQAICNFFDISAFSNFLIWKPSFCHTTSINQVEMKEKTGPILPVVLDYFQAYRSIDSSFFPPRHVLFSLITICKSYIVQINDRDISH